MEARGGPGADRDARGPRRRDDSRAGLAAPPEAFVAGTRVSFTLKRGVWGWVAREVQPLPPATAPSSSADAPVAARLRVTVFGGAPASGREGADGQ
jgi:hypothetical protein